MLNKIIFQLSMYLSVLDGSAGSQLEIYRKFSLSLSRSSSMILLCKVMQHTESYVHYLAGPQTMAKLFTIVNAYKMVSSSNK
jgi:hypothetical protein